LSSAPAIRLAVSFFLAISLLDLALLVIQSFRF
jgi:hypothetical protein